MTDAITVLGAGVLGLWQALRLARAGYSVSLVDTSPDPLSESTSALAGTMLAPDCEFQTVYRSARTFARQGLRDWMDRFDCVTQNGSLVIADYAAELADFENQSENSRRVNRIEIEELEPALGSRHGQGLYFAQEAHMETETALMALLTAVQDAGVNCHFGVPDEDISKSTKDTIVIDCRGLAAQDKLAGLRGVRGERIVIKTVAIHLTRPIRLLHLRQPIYIVPWTDHRFMIGSTMIESEDQSQVTVKSAVDLLAMAYHLHPSFGEAEILEFGAAVRPAFQDNLPRVIVDECGRYIHVNGAYRHGFLLAPVLANITVNYLNSGTAHPLLITDNTACNAGLAELKVAR